FAYYFYRAGKLLDEYVSIPGYFSKSDLSREEKLTGHPQSYSDLLVRPLEEVKAVLKRDDPDLKELWPAERMEQFAAALGISNVATAYDYLEQGETASTKLWRQFIHIPDKGPEQLKARQHATALREQLKQLKSTGILLAHH